MLPSLDNFVSYGTDVFRARPDYRQKALNIYVAALSSDHLGENDRVNGCKLAESLLLNLRGHIDDVSPAVHIHLLLLLMTIPKHRNSSISSQLHSVTLTKPKQSRLSWRTSKCSSMRYSTTRVLPLRLWTVSAGMGRSCSSAAGLRPLIRSMGCRVCTTKHCRSSQCRRCLR